MAEVTPTQGRYLAFIREYTEGFGLPPAESEIAAAIGVAPPSVNQMMKTLEKKGIIRRQPGVARSIDGERACPPEDTGGVYGFADYVEAITDPKHPDYEELLEWAGPFDPVQFDANEATRRMME